ncbi:hypothetical protein [Caballeronia sp. dw_276]|uniref:hypothetical protein n=1 Tax=Caballeronia sp. dw_276 TaxID=2719795 RepID=UPI001BD269AB|nr:hypothetical protein [Caballeronia sp. dw_276]
MREIRNIDEWLRPQLAVIVRSLGSNGYEGLFGLSLRARILWSFSRFACEPGSADFVYLSDEALSLAAYAGLVAVNDPDEHLIVPALLDDVPELRSAFIEEAEDTRAMIADAQRELEEQQRQKAERERIKKLIAVNAWAELHLPTPEDLTATLATGESVSIECHSVVYDSADNLTWYTNPYGIDGVLFNGLPTLAGVRRFLTDMARGVDYGPTPDWQDK